MFKSSSNTSRVGRPHRELVHRIQHSTCLYELRFDRAERQEHRNSVEQVCGIRPYDNCYSGHLTVESRRTLVTRDRKSVV